MPFPCTENAAAGSGPAAAFRALGGAGVVGVVLRVAEFDCVLQLVDPRVGEVRDLRDRQKVIAAECGSAIPVGAAAEKAGDVDAVDAVEHAMSTMADTKGRRGRRSFTDDYKTGAVRLVLDEGKTVASAARDLGLTESSLRNWVEQARADRTKGKTGLTTAEREELARLRKEVRELRERDVLKKAAAFFARDHL